MLSHMSYCQDQVSYVAAFTWCSRASLLLRVPAGFEPVLPFARAAFPLRPFGTAPVSSSQPYASDYVSSTFAFTSARHFRALSFWDSRHVEQRQPFRYMVEP
jgi:hypothetical protein